MQEILDEVPEQVAKFQTGHFYRLPLWELVYHDCVVAQWYWGDYNNKRPTSFLSRLAQRACRWAGPPRTKASGGKDGSMVNTCRSGVGELTWQVAEAYPGHILVRRIWIASKKSRKVHRRMAIPFSGRLTAAKHVLAQELQGELVLLNLTSERYFGLDETSSSMWRELTRAQSLEAAYERLLSVYEVGPEQLRDDLRNFVSQLVENDLLEVSG